MTATTPGLRTVPSVVQSALTSPPRLEEALVAPTPVPRSPDASPLPPILTTERIADLFGMPSGPAALKAIKRHNVPYCKFGKRVVVLTDSLLDFLKLGERNAVQDEGEIAEQRIAATSNLRVAVTKLGRRRGPDLPAAARALTRKPTTT